MNCNISILICCYNSAQRIEKTLKSLSTQKFDVDAQVEIILIDNNSSDQTAAVAQKYWQQLNSNFDFRVIVEKKAGKVNAIKTGVLNASHEIILFVDDDNSLDENYAQNIIALFDEHSNVGVIGGAGALPNEVEFKQVPEWWDFVKEAFAIRNEPEGYIDAVAGAGMGMRKTCYLQLLEQNFEFALSGRKGNKTITSGSDYEICYAIQLLGYKVLFSPRLTFVHHIDINRINYAYMEKLYLGFGIAHPYLYAYECISKNNEPNKALKQLFIARVKYLGRKVQVFFNKMGLGKQNLSENYLMQLFNKGRVEILSSMDKNAYNNFLKRIKLIRDKN